MTHAQDALIRPDSVYSPQTTGDLSKKRSQNSERRFSTGNVRSGRDQSNRTMVIAVITVDMVQVTIDKVVDVVAMRNRWVTTPRPMNMVHLVTAADVCRRACVRVGVRDRNRVLIHVAIMGMVQVTIVKVIDVAVMHDGLMTTTGSMNMVMGFVDFAIAHRNTPLEPHLRRSSSTWSKVLVNRSRT